MKLKKLKNHFSHVRSTIAHHNKTNSFIPKHLHICKYVFVLTNNPHTLQQPYEEPFEVVSRTYKNKVGSST